MMNLIFSTICFGFFFLNQLAVIIAKVIRWVRREKLFLFKKHFCFHFSLSSSKALTGIDDFCGHCH